MHIALIHCLHGDEQLGHAIAGEIGKRFPSVHIILGNPDALAAHTRYIETDLNRSFPGSAGGSLEERRAHAILHELHALHVDAVIDLHTTTALTESFIITTQTTTAVERIIAACPLQKVVHMPHAMSRGRALIDHVPGVSLEFADAMSFADALAVVETTMRNLLSGTSSLVVHERYTGIDVLRGSVLFENFALVASGTRHGDFVAERDFYPVLSGEEAYAGNISCIRVVRLL